MEGQGLRPKPLRDADRVALSNERWRMARHSALKECTESRCVGVKESDLQQLSSPRKQVITSLPYRSCFVFRDTVILYVISHEMQTRMQLPSLTGATYEQDK
jgi:hypothetical protein